MDEQELSVLALRIAEAVFKIPKKRFFNATEVLCQPQVLRVYNLTELL